MTFGAAWTLKTELPPARELNFHKIAEFRKIRKSTKKWSEKRPQGRGKNRLCDPICLRVGGLAAPAGTNMCPYGSTMQKMSKAGLPETKKLVQDTEKQRKTCLESAQKRPSAKKQRASCVWVGGENFVPILLLPSWLAGMLDGWLAITHNALPPDGGAFL